MLQSKTSGTLVAEMLMVRAGGWAGIFLVLEGPDDASFFSSRVAVPPEAIVIADGARNLQECMSNLPVPLQASVCAVADSDFRRFLPVDPFAGCKNTFFYDEGFLETFLVNTRALRKVVGAHASFAKLRAFDMSIRPRTVFSHLRQICSVFGQLRVLNESNGWGLSINADFTPYKYIDGDWTLNEAALLRDVSARIGCSSEELKARCESVGRRGCLSLVHGHDLLKVLVIGLRGALGSGPIGQDRLLADLCLAAEAVDLAPKTLFRDLRRWAGARPLLYS